MLFFHYHAPHRDRDLRGGRAARLSTAASTCRDQYGGWQIEVTPRPVGVTIRRQQYRAVVRHSSLGLFHALDGFPSADAACEAARQWIDGQANRRRVAAQHRRVTQARDSARRAGRR